MHFVMTNETKGLQPSDISPTLACLDVPIDRARLAQPVLFADAEAAAVAAEEVAMDPAEEEMMAAVTDAVAAAAAGVSAAGAAEAESPEVECAIRENGVTAAAPHLLRPVTPPHVDELTVLSTPGTSHALEAATVAEARGLEAQLARAVADSLLTEALVAHALEITLTPRSCAHRPPGGKVPPSTTCSRGGSCMGSPRGSLHGSLHGSRVASRASSLCGSRVGSRQRSRRASRGNIEGIERD